MSCYLDYNASAPTRDEVIDAVADAMKRAGGNPSSMHAYGRRAAGELQGARERVAELMGAAPRHVVFTSGATESNNLALRGFAGAHPEGRLITSTMEHASVLNTLTALADQGASVETVSVDGNGRLDLQSLVALAGRTPSMIALGWANGETGHVTDIAEIARELPGGSLLHVDASQAAGRILVRFDAGINTMALAGHKLGGPLGIGVLLVRDSTLVPLMSGGSHEGGLRPGTENIPGAVGLCVALELACKEMIAENRRLHELREGLWDFLNSRFSDVLRISPPGGLPNTLTIGVADTDSDVLIAGLDLAGYCVSSGSACAAGSPEPSHVVRALAVPERYSRGVIRVSMGKSTADSDIKGFGEALVEVIGRARRAA